MTHFTTTKRRAISFGEMLTSRNLYIVLVIFAMGALGAFVYTGQQVNSTSSINSTLSEPEAKKVKLNGALVTALANLPGNTTLSLAGITAAFPANATGAYDLSGTDKKIVVGVLGTNKTSAFDGSAYRNDTSVYSTEDRATASRVLVSNADLGQDILGYEYAGTGAVLGASVAYFYVSNVGGSGLVAAASPAPAAPAAPVGPSCSPVSAGGYTYATVLGNDGKCWTSENMKHVSSAGTTLCYGNVPSNCDAYGALYDWSAANGDVCTALGAGWSLPTESQFATLVSNGGTGWTGDRLGGITNFLGGSYYPGGSGFSGKDASGLWWTSTASPPMPGPPSAQNVYMGVSLGTSVFLNGYETAVGMSVVCVQN